MKNKTPRILKRIGIFWRDKLRTILTVIAVFIGAFTIALTSAVNVGVNDYIDKQIGIFGNDSTFLEVSKKMENSPFGDSEGPTEYNPNQTSMNMAGMSYETLSDKDLEKIKAIAGIEKIEPSKAVAIEYIEGANSKKFSINARSTISGMVLDTKSGQPIDVDSDQPEINLPASYVEALGFENDEDAIGATVKLAVKNSATGKTEETTAKVVGILNKSLAQDMVGFYNQAALDEMFELQTAGLPDAMKHNYIGAMANLETDFTSGDNLEKIKKSLDGAGYRGLTIEDQIGMVRDIVNAITGALILFGAIALLAASFGIINTLYMSVQERTREIGLLKAMGMSNGRVFRIFSLEAIMIGFWGSLLGLGAAMLAGTVINNYASETFLKGLEGFNLTVFTPLNALIVCLVIMVIAFIAGALPSRRAAKQDPIEALRYE
jgi:putative ABC transport system permease protein